jgi:hypothetical protein
MALGTTMKSAIKRVANPLVDFASQEGWKPDEYQVLFHQSSRWGRIRVFFIAKNFGGLSRQDMWARVSDHLEKEIAKGPDIGYSLGLSVRDWDQVNQGGAYSVPPGYIDYRELLMTPSVADGRQ